MLNAKDSDRIPLQKELTISSDDDTILIYVSAHARCKTSKNACIACLATIFKGEIFFDQASNVSCREIRTAKTICWSDFIPVSVP